MSECSKYSEYSNKRTNLLLIDFWWIKSVFLSLNIEVVIK